MKPLRVLLPFEDALETVAKHISPMDRTEEVPLDEAGGRVLAVTAWAGDMRTAVDRAYQGVAAIQFEGAHFRRDIARRAFERL